jgi:3'-phosphoadenosine 5'-phosphosulfate sulfotransferase (PAPS reductase)/FAD synthetase
LEITGANRESRAHLVRKNQQAAEEGQGRWAMRLEETGLNKTERGHKHDAKHALAQNFKRLGGVTIPYPNNFLPRSNMIYQCAL